MEARPLHEGIDERLFVRFQLRFPTRSPYYHILSHRARGWQELGILRTNPVSCPVNSINQSAGLLELNGQEVCRRDILSSAIDACVVVATLQYLIAPEIETGFVRFTSQEIEIVLTHEIFWRV